MVSCFPNSLQMRNLGVQNSLERGLFASAACACALALVLVVGCLVTPSIAADPVQDTPFVQFVSNRFAFDKDPTLPKGIGRWPVVRRENTVSRANNSARCSVAYGYHLPIALSVTICTV